MVEQIAKRPKSSYIHFSNNKTVRDEIKQQHPDWTVTQVASHLGQRWKQMGGDDKQKWINLYLEEKKSLLENPIYVVKKKRKPRSVLDCKTLDKRIDDIEMVVNQLQNEVISLKHTVIG
jgi:hypothetical protein